MAMYIGGGGKIPIGTGGPIVRGPFTQGGDTGNKPIGLFRLPTPSSGIQPTPTPTPATTSPNVLNAQSVRPTGSSGGFDPQYLQNLTTAIGGLFSRPGGSLSFNPLGNLSDISSPNLGFGSAPSPGLPSTLLQDAINSLAFMFNQPASAAPSSTNSGGGGFGGSNGGGRGRFPNLQ